MQPLKLISEVFNEDCETITESIDNKKQYFIEGRFMQGDIVNRNNRVYPTIVLENEMHRYTREFIETKRSLGELGHPKGPQINGDRVSHLIIEMSKHGNDFYGKAKIISTPMGEIVKTFIDEGVKIGVSTRGLGSVKSNGEGLDEVQSDFKLYTVDIVTDPSGPECFVNGIMENTDFFYDTVSGNYRAAHIIEQTVEKFKKSKKKKITEAQKIEAFQRFLTSL